MADMNNKNGAKDDAARGMPYYEKQRRDLHESIAKRRQLERALNNLEDSIYKAETQYLEETPAGNIIKGFDNYVKGTNASANPAGRRKAAVSEMDRVFSRPVLTTNGDSPAPSSAYGTNAPTPQSSTFVKDPGSNHATPTSATSANRIGGPLKKVKKNGDDSETDSKDGKKRTNFSVARK